MATMEEIAQKAGVSQATVSRVINGSTSVSIETRQNVMQWIRKLDYQPNRTAQSLAKKQSYLLGMVLPDISNPYFAEVLKIIEQEANLNGYNIIFCNSGDNVQKEKHAINTLRSRQVDGMFIVPVEPDAPHLNTLRNSRIPVVAVTCDVDGFDSVAISHQHGGALVANHLLETGHTRIGYIGARHEEKFQGFYDAFLKHGVAFSDAYVIELGKGSELPESHEIHEKFSTFLKERERLDTTAFFISTDLGAIIVSHILIEQGYRIPEDVAIVGFDNTFLAVEMRPTLTSVAQPIAEIGRLAVETLLERITSQDIRENKIKIILEPYLMVRESTRKIGRQA
ncbi:periplasmic binding protein/LacI transcriptional regulator [Candidatus Moduliflexus flocculans]|uniref:Periplasmic binding protein/LacI transcriptional regulator n=1 Tax=Candidatus Moduliflexus flocculans TaxID=1499966 RepID=A0A0S6VWQ0_9BACT|nr:periplasmic binding protein/LacI transcriptional regulator [Candidatus Moduliflexus flocculans]